MRISDWSSDVCSSDLHGDAEPAAVGHRAVEILREFARVVAVEPIFIVERRADGANALANRVEILFGRKWAGGGHNLSPWSGAGKRAARGLQMGNIVHLAVDAERAGVGAGRKGIDDFLGFGDLLIGGAEAADRKRTRLNSSP